MNPDQFLAQVGPVFLAPGMAGVVSFLGALVLGTVIVKGRRVPPWAVALVAGLPMVVVAVAVRIALAEAGAADLEGLQARMVAAIGPRVFAPLFVLPGVVVFALTGVAGAARGGRGVGAGSGFGPSALVALAAVALAGFPIAVGVAEDDLGLAIVRAVGHAALGLVAAVAVWGVTRDPSRAVAGASALAVVPIGVAALSAAERALPELILSFTLPGRLPENRMAYLDRGWPEVVDPWVSPSWIELGLASLLLGIGLGFVARGARSSWVALVAIPLAAMPLLFGPTLADFQALADLLPAP